MDSIVGLIIQSSKVCTRMISNMELGNSPILMEKYLKASGSMEKDKAKELLFIKIRSIFTSGKIIKLLLKRENIELSNDNQPY